MSPCFIEADACRLSMESSRKMSSLSPSASWSAHRRFRVQATCEADVALDRTVLDLADKRALSIRTSEEEFARCRYLPPSKPTIRLAESFGETAPQIFGPGKAFDGVGKPLDMFPSVRTLGASSAATSPTSKASKAMGGTGVIDSFLETFTSYIDSGFGLLGGEVGFLASTLAAIDITLRRCFGPGDRMRTSSLVSSRRPIRWRLRLPHRQLEQSRENHLPELFRLVSKPRQRALSRRFSAAGTRRAGRNRRGHPILTVISSLMGYVSFFENFLQIVVLLFAWFIILLSFFILAIQLFVTLIEFKLTTLAGFVLIPSALSARPLSRERVLGNVVSSGVKCWCSPSSSDRLDLVHAITQGSAARSPQSTTPWRSSLPRYLCSGSAYSDPDRQWHRLGWPQLGAGAAVGTALSPLALRSRVLARRAWRAEHWPVLRQSRHARRDDDSAGTRSGARARGSLQRTAPVAPAVLRKEERAPHPRSPRWP